MGTLGEQIEPELRDDAVLADQRNNVGQRADRRDLDESRQPDLAVRAPAQGLNQLQRDADARQILVGIATVVPLRVDDGQRLRQLGVWFVVIRDDQVDAELVRPPPGVGAANAAIDGDDQLNAIRVQSLDRDRQKPITVLQPLGDEMDDIRAEHFECAAQDDGGGDAVHVVVAVDRNPLVAGDRRDNSIDRSAHVGQQHRIVQVIERRIEKAPGDFRV